MNYLEKYLPKRKDPSAAAIQRDDEAWQQALNRVNGANAPSGVSKPGEHNVPAAELDPWSKAIKDLGRQNSL